MRLSGLCDLHCHYLPCVDDGVRSTEDGLRLCVGLAQLGYDIVVATPHIRAAMFENNKADLSEIFACFVAAAAREPEMPETGLAAEHFCDDVFFELLEQGNALPYPGGHAVLIEFPPERLPVRLAEQFFRMQVRGIRPVIAHPERYAPIWKELEPLEALVDHGALALLDVMSLSGKYGRKPMRAAEELLEAGLYYAACTDSHKPEDLETVERSIERLSALVGAQEAQALLGERPRSILAGDIED